jgi:hypothetical protein
MPKTIKTTRELRPGDFYEDCAYHPCLCIATRRGTVEGISLVDGSYPRNCGVPHCGVRKLTFKEAVTWKLHGPPDVPPEIEMTDAQKYWLRNESQGRQYYPQFLPKVQKRHRNG